MRNPFRRNPDPRSTQTASADVLAACRRIAQRILEIERQHNLGEIESAQTLIDLGLDASTIENSDAIPTINHIKLEQFAKKYEVRLERLLTGEGRVHQPMYPAMNPLEFTRRIAELWLFNQLRGIYMISNRSQPLANAYSTVSLVVARAHPQLGDPHQTFETWPCIRFDSPGRIAVLTLIQLMLEIADQTSDQQFKPRGITLLSARYTVWENGMLLPVSAISSLPPVWSPAAILDLHRPDLDDEILWSMVGPLCGFDWLLRAFQVATGILLETETD
jgi:hypothetical protein